MTHTRVRLCGKQGPSGAGMKVRIRLDGTLVSEEGNAAAAAAGESLSFGLCDPHCLSLCVIVCEYCCLRLSVIVCDHHCL